MTEKWPLVSHFPSANGCGQKTHGWIRQPQQTAFDRRRTIAGLVRKSPCTASRICRAMAQTLAPAFVTRLEPMLVLWLEIDQRRKPSWSEVFLKTRALSAVLVPVLDHRCSQWR